LAGNWSTLSESALRDRCLQGDERAWEELYRRYYGLVRKVVTWPRWTLPYRDADDLIQDVFLELVRALPGFRGQAALSTFITRLAKNKCISLLRQKLALKRAAEDTGRPLEETRGDDDAVPALAISKDPGPEEAVLKAAEISVLLSCLEYLNPECQEVIRRRYFQHLSYTDICNELDLPLGTLCSRLKRCLTRLRNLFEQRVAA